ncbi:hypothetical protein DSECCO2_538890 [anaerobic digester metagenome]
MVQIWKFNAIYEKPVFVGTSAPDYQVVPLSRRLTDARKRLYDFRNVAVSARIFFYFADSDGLQGNRAFDVSFKGGRRYRYTAKCGYVFCYRYFDECLI